MVLAVHKTRKKINKKGGDIKALHENSRGKERLRFFRIIRKSYINYFSDSMRLRRAVLRDEKVLRIGANKRKDNQPLSTSYYIPQDQSIGTNIIISCSRCFLPERHSHERGQGDVHGAGQASH